MEWDRSGAAGGELRWTLYDTFPSTFRADFGSRGHPMDDHVLLHANKQMPCWYWRRILLGPVYCQCRLYLYDKPTIHLLKLATPASHDRSVKINFGNQILLQRNITPSQDEPWRKPYQSSKEGCSWNINVLRDLSPFSSENCARFWSFSNPSFSLPHFPSLPHTWLHFYHAKGLLWSHNALLP